MTRMPTDEAEYATAIAPPVPTARPTLEARAAPTRAPTPASPVTTPSWKGLRSRTSRAYGATTTPTVAFATNQTWVLIARVVSPERPYTHRTPSLISRRRWGASPVSPAACSWVPNVATVIADIRYVAEFTRTARGAPTTPTSTPANAGPDVWATASAPSSRAWHAAGARRARAAAGTTSTRASLTSDAVPNAATMTSSSGSDSTSTAQATGMAVSSAARVRSVATMTGRRRRRSTSAPTSSPSTRYGSQRAELSHPTCCAVPSSVRTTRVCSASSVT